MDIIYSRAFNGWYIDRSVHNVPFMVFETKQEAQEYLREKSS